MKTLLGFLMMANAVLFFFGAIQHVGVTIGRFHEPRIIPAAIVETICGISLASGAVIVLSRTVLPWSAPLVSNFIALGGVLLGMIALAAGRGPRTASNDLYHHIMLSLIGASLLALMLAKSGARQP
ncbi:MAG: hypothetical protein JWN74_902 [Acidobacteriaceae bacterium]|nr:hypothetical protein [Acidobacteriaceae bacterium]